MNEGGKVLRQATPPVCSTPMACCTTPRVRCNPRPGHRPAALPALVRLVLRWRRHQRRACSTAGGYVAVANDGHVEARVRPDRRQRTVHGPAWGFDDPVFAGNTFEVVVPRDERRACRPTSSSSSTAGPRAVRQARRPVRPGTPEQYVTADRRRHLQEAHPRDRRTGSWPR